MSCVINHPGRNDADARVDHARILVSLELSRHKWLVTSLAPDSEKMSKYSVAGGNGRALLDLLARLKARAQQRLDAPVDVVVIQEIGLDGFWIHRLLKSNGIDSHPVEAGSIAVSRRRRRAKTDRIDGEALIRTLAAWLRGEPRVCTMVHEPSPEEEDRRRLTRERDNLLEERVRHTNRIKGLLCGQGITDYEPLHPDRLSRLETLTTGDGRPLPVRLKAEIRRELERIDLVSAQLRAVEGERDALLAAASSDPAEPASVLLRLKGIGPQLGARLWLEALFRRFDNRRQVAAYAGLAPSPWQSGTCERDQGIGKSGNPRVRHTMVELAWLWLRHQPDSALSRWFRQRVGLARGRVRRIAIVALARKLLIALWRYTSQGVLPEGAVLKA